MQLANTKVAEGLDGESALTVHQLALALFHSFGKHDPTLRLFNAVLEYYKSIDGQEGNVAAAYSQIGSIVK